MIKIEKDVSAIPDSIQLPFVEYFPLRISVIAKHTHEKRIELIGNKNYIDDRKYNDRYKQDDIKTALKKIYNNKCGYCERKPVQPHVDHYRPKSTYYWLAYSWDNLVLACPSCNHHKGTQFEIKGIQVEFEYNEENLKNIHCSSVYYDSVELPQMVNPEITDPLNKIRFERNGVVESDDVRFDYTIRTCNINSTDLKDERRRLLDVFRRDIKSIFLENNVENSQIHDYYTIIKKFIRDSKDEDSEYLAFRRYAISKSWLNEITKETTN